MIKLTASLYIQRETTELFKKKQQQQQQHMSCVYIYISNFRLFCLHIFERMNEFESLNKRDLYIYI
jgi:hypothetical protein